MHIYYVSLRKIAQKMIKTKQEVEQFLNQFNIKFDVWGIFYLICISFHVAEHPIKYVYK